MKNRRAIRLRGYDYSQDGAYFITICTQNRECLFGDIADGEMVVNDAGTMIQKWYLELENKFASITVDECVVMPNHFHGIIIIKKTVGADLVGADLVEADLCVRPDSIAGTHAGAPLQDSPAGAPVQDSPAGAPLQDLPAGVFVSEVVQWFKTMTTNEYIRGVKQNKWPPFNQRLWQRNYYEHIIRDESSFKRICEYIQNNPAQWESDENNPKRDKIKL